MVDSKPCTTPVDASSKLSGDTGDLNSDLTTILDLHSPEYFIRSSAGLSSHA
jgi:hypothetical protein